MTRPFDRIIQLEPDNSTLERIIVAVTQFLKSMNEQVTLDVNGRKVEVLRSDAPRFLEELTNFKQVATEVWTEPTTTVIPNKYHNP